MIDNKLDVQLIEKEYQMNVEQKSFMMSKGIINLQPH